MIDDESPEVWEYVTWWEDFELFGALPFGSASIHEEPAIAYDVLKSCARFKAQVQLEAHEQIERENEEIRRKLGMR